MEGNFLAKHRPVVKKELVRFRRYIYISRSFVEVITLCTTGALFFFHNVHPVVANWWQDLMMSWEKMLTMSPL